MEVGAYCSFYRIQFPVQHTKVWKEPGIHAWKLIIYRLKTRPACAIVLCLEDGLEVRAVDCVGAVKSGLEEILDDGEFDCSRAQQIPSFFWAQNILQTWSALILRSPVCKFGMSPT